MRRPALLKTGLPLWLEIVLVLALKAALLWGAWSLWFAQPIARHMTVPEPAVSQQLLGQPSAPISHPTGDKHATRR
ncbi:hypothetical protein EV683_11252 [Crenobacter luteus]|uniref:Uncharacterized protein n=1 Tax=Crenobacter luteus TaxID=1452487 RepID=A0A163B919_9NEIS|nr:cytochrome oxidase putative small subunit CydP [Crenobacter luteus]KZE25274.1 hypothetical protein AVW16_02940 [Crenobacter luteus]TCP11588.1 hypothetical protein EV683_11252 [Crenobacter luteus]